MKDLLPKDSLINNNRIGNELTSLLTISKAQTR
jgi:hypothetical protein